MSKFEALLIGQTPGLMRALPDLLGRAGFVVDVISTAPLLFRSHALRHVHPVTGTDGLLRAAREMPLDIYALVVVSDDMTLQLIRDAALPDDVKRKILPVNAERQYRHLFSKIGLARALEEGGLRAPAYRVAAGPDEIADHAAVLGYPVLVKLDASAGGGGVFECRSVEDVRALGKKRLVFPLLVQKKIEGRVVDLSGFYQDGKLIHFTYSIFEATAKGRFGPSSWRRYLQLSEADRSVFDELSALGQALGIHGFTNVTCIQADDDRQRYYTEADLRPTVWADCGKYLGNDAATAVKDYFESGKTLAYPQPRQAAHPRSMLIPYIYRLGIREVLSNHRGCWKFIARENQLYLARKLVEQVMVKFRRLLARLRLSRATG